MDKDFYTIKEIANKYSVSTRTVERHLKSLLTKEGKKITVPQDVVKLLEARHYSDTTPTFTPTQLRHNSDNHDNDVAVNEKEVEFDVVEGFTTEEYQEFQKRLIEYPMLIKDLEYHRESVRSHQRQMEMILANFNARNIIEGRDKGII